MRILVTANKVPFMPGGADYHIHGLVENLKLHGHEVELLQFPFRFSPESEVQRLMDYCEGTELNMPNGLAVDKVISLKTLVIGPQRVRLSMEVEFLGAALIDRAQLELDAEKIKAGTDALPILAAGSARMVRLVGTEINRLEHALHERFPSIVTIDLEVN